FGFVPPTEVVDAQTLSTSTVQPSDVIVDVVLRPEPTVEPSGRAPGQPGQDDGGVALARFVHQPPLVATVGDDLVRAAHVAGLGAGGGVRVPADLDPQDLQCSAVSGPEKVVEHPATLGFRIVDEQPGRSPGRQRSHTVEDPSGRSGVQRDDLRHIWSLPRGRRSERARILLFLYT